MTSPPTSPRTGAVRRRLVELSHPVRHGTVTYPGLPGPEVSPYLTREASQAHYAPCTSFEISQVRMVGNTGTYLDAPLHRFASGADVAALPAERFADLEGVVVVGPPAGGAERTPPSSGRVRPAELTGRELRAIDREAFLPYQVAGRAVLVRTGWDARFGTDGYAPGEHLYLTADAARHLVTAGAALVGIDSVNIDDVADGARPAHTTLLEAGIPIVEHLTGLDALPVTGFRFHAAPAPIIGMATFPVRAYAVVGD